MSDSDTLYLPVSLGEAIDKLTILDIKLARITDTRKVDVQKEHALLYEKLAAYVSKYESLYTSMKKVNTIIWDYMDALRDGTLDEDAYFKLCKKTIELNDVRFRIKNKINYAAGSLLKEQKGYKINSILIDIHDDVTSVDKFIKPIRYYSCLYDQVVIRYNGVGTIRELLSDDPTIIFINELEAGKEFKHTFIVSKEFYMLEDILKIFNINDINTMTNFI